MRIWLNHLRLICRESTEVVYFGRLSFFHGEMSAGKSTIPELVDYCLGGRLVRTQAIASELIRVELELEIRESKVLIERNPAIVGSVDIAWEDDTSGRETLPLSAPSNPIIEPNIFNLSDFILQKLGLPVIRVRTRTNDSDSELTRLSFRDLFEFVYLNQKDLDSSFFLLEQPHRAEKSKDALRYFVGFHTDRLSELETELGRVRVDQRTKKETADQITTFLNQFGYASESEISDQIAALSAESESLSTALEQLRADNLPMTTVSEEQRQRLEQLAGMLKAVDDSVDEVDRRIGEQTALQAELISMKFKATRIQGASQILSGVRFTSCPVCSSELNRPESAGVCYLCHSSLGDVPANRELGHVVIEQDLSDRIDDLKRSIRTLKRSLQSQLRRQEGVRVEYAEADRAIRGSRRAAESEYVQRARSLESRQGAVRERIRQLTRIRQMPYEVEKIRKEADALNAHMSELRRLISEEEAKLDSAEDNIRALEANFLRTLLRFGFPGVSNADRVRINRRTWYPYVLTDQREDRAWTFDDASSGGKMVLFKIGFVLALHLTAAQRSLPVPQILIIDSTMKNIATDINPEVFQRFYAYLYELMTSELRGWQVIVIDQTYRPPPDSISNVVARFMTPDDENNPPLIGYYRGA